MPVRLRKNVYNDRLNPISRRKTVRTAQAFIISLLMLVLPPPALAEEAPVEQECVVLLHGLWRTELSMKWLQWALDDAGFSTSNPTYPSLRYPIEELAVRAVEQGLYECGLHQPQRIHFVTHSLGGILIRQYTAHHDIPGLHRVVMLGPPNQGSQVADYVYSLDLLQPLSPDAVEQLGTGENSVPLRLGPVSFELGVIAGTASSGGVIPGTPIEASDGTVAVAETKVPGMRDFLELPVGHTFMMWSPAVRDQVVYFLRRGQFDRSVVTTVQP